MPLSPSSMFLLEERWQTMQCTGIKPAVTFKMNNNNKNHF